MKKILFLVAIIATTLLFTSCVKSNEFYRGDSKVFNYTRSSLNPVLVGVPINGVATIVANGQMISLQCITPSNPNGDALVIDAPVVPSEWEWFNNNGVGEYRPSGMTYNAAGGFSANYGRCYFVEIFANGTYRFWNGVSVPMDPINVHAWVSSFEYPRTWAQNLPIRATILKPTPTTYRMIIP
ncbi:MAG: hypothetical protein QG674_341 [Patescibacteria group bacterium]|jgi:hypothetical protein|nr:hypothetical protein [Patescibacteria group bacterium]